jgi:hypothetical protein
MVNFPLISVVVWTGVALPARVVQAWSLLLELLISSLFLLDWLSDFIKLFQVACTLLSKTARGECIE